MSLPHCLSHRSPTFMSPYGVTRSQWVKVSDHQLCDIQIHTQLLSTDVWASVDWAVGHLVVRSREVSKPRDSGLDLSNRTKIDSHLGSRTTEMPVEFQSDTIITTSNVTASRLHEIWRKTSYRSVNRYMYSISQEICTRFLLCCALLWLYIDWFSHIDQAYFTGTVAI